MAVSVVDLFEVVQVDEQEGRDPVVVAAGEVLGGVVVQLTAVGQPGQVVVEPLTVGRAVRATGDAPEVVSP